jgi:hypothetical protein
MRSEVFCTLAFLLLSLCYTCEIRTNNKTLILQEAELLNKTTNGEKLLLGNLNSSEQNYLYIARVKGTPF